MEYLQYFRELKYTIDTYSSVLNLIINGIPSIQTAIPPEEAKRIMF